MMSEKPFERVLIANRGEIAVRIARAAASLGMHSVAVYTHQDRHSLHTQLADEAVQLTQADGVAGYLNIDEIMAVAAAQACDCIHPGYGFLAENAQLARACQAAGIRFVGPSEDALALFGDKVRARELAESLHVPVIPGSNGRVDDAEAATAIADKIGFPVMLKASAGGGGRGMRVVQAPEQMAEAFRACRSEAQSAFGNGDVFIEKYLPAPKHIEVQVLADSHGHAMHLRERDCSIQQRHQKVVEIAPAATLPEALLQALHQAALKLIQAVNYSNAGTVEFLVEPEASRFYFIECNPRIQVEHTITEQIFGIDLVAAQFRIAAGSTLADLSFDTLTPRGCAVQSRVVVHGGGQLSAYKEPSGPGIRVDAHGYQGYAPPSSFDPLLAKVICHAPNGTLKDALALSLRAMQEFHITGTDTNQALLEAILADSRVTSGDARIDYLSRHAPAINPASQRTNKAQAFLAMQSRLAAAQPHVAAAETAGLSVAEGTMGVECPMAGSVITLRAAPGDLVKRGQPLMVVSAMKMETTVDAPVTGTITAMLELLEGDSVAAGTVVATILPSEADAADPLDEAATGWQPLLEEVSTLQALAHARLAKDSDEPGVVRQRARGKLTCRERIDLLLDAGTFREVGSLAGFASYDDQGYVDAFTPANHVGGWGDIEGRPGVVCADDFTSRGGHADGAIGAKSLYLDRLAVEMRIPSVRLLDGSSGGGSVAAMVPQQKQAGESKAEECSGAIKAGRPRVAGSGGSFLPGHLGSSFYTHQLNTVPVVNMLLGSVVGIGAAKAVLGHFSVMVRDIAQLFVAGPPVVSHAMGYDISKEDLGGWQVHCTNGSVDNLAASEAEAVAMTKMFLAFLPGSVYEVPPVTACADPVNRAAAELLDIIPRSRTATFDIRRTIRLMVDDGDFFEIGSLWGTDQVTGLARFNGHPVGVIASDSRHINGGAMTADGCDKLKRHLDVCDTFHLPILNLIDNPGFAVGIEHERSGTIRKGGEWMVAFAQVQVPIFTVIMRRSFGVAGNNFATPTSRANVRVAWPAADVGGIPPEGGIEAAYKRQLAEAEDPAALRAELEARIESARGPVGPLNRFQIEEMIDPRLTRQYICEWVRSAYRIIDQRDRLGPRSIQFRP